MADAHNTVEDIEHVNIEGMGGDADDVDESTDGNEGADDQQTGSDMNDGEGTDGDGTGEGDGQQGGQSKEHIVRRQPENQTQPTDGSDDDNIGDDNGDGDLKPVEGETPREFALRKELSKTRRILREKRGTELLGNQPAPTTSTRELSDAQKEVLGKYKPEELQSLQEVLPILAEQMGFVRAETLHTQTYSEKASAEFDAFLTAHPEYLPENDKDNLLWGQFTEQFALYKTPKNPQDFRRIFNRIHTEISGVKTKDGNGKGKVDAQRHNVSVAAHQGTSTTAPQNRPGARRAPAASGLRLDMLKGFTEDELKELEED